MAETMEGEKRSAYCGSFRKEDAGKKVTVCGFVSRQRELSGLIFIVLRDRTGSLQLAFDATTDPIVFKKAEKVRGEYVLMASGIVRVRESVNPSLPTGEVELFVEDLRILSKAATPPFEVRDGNKVGEELRLKYRYLDLRRPQMQENIINRHRIVKLTRDYYDKNHFLEIETPTLIASTPEGARDFLVPSRLRPGAFYSLPQSPQLYKQLLMISGFDRYMQIAKCYRDEDLRADRQPEFTQIDTEMSFVDQEDVMAMTEGYLRFLFAEFLDIDLPPIPRISYEEALNRYGSDKPDTRFALELKDLSAPLQNTQFKIFRGPLEEGGAVFAINVKGKADQLTRKEIDKLTDLVKGYGLGGLAFLRLTGEGESSSYEKFLSEEECAAIRLITEAQTGDVILIAAHQDPFLVKTSLGGLRSELGRRFSLYDPSTFDVLWVVDFPLFEWNPEEKRYVALHHPFTAPQDADLPALTSDPGKVKAKAYDIVINGYEVGGGSIRIHDPSIQETVFQTIGFTPEEAKTRFGFFLEAFQYGVPPHGGLAFGLDRLVMVLTGTDNIKDVIAFPKLQNASDPMCNAPSPVDAAQLAELHICLEENPPKK